MPAKPTPTEPESPAQDVEQPPVIDPPAEPDPAPPVEDLDPPAPAGPERVSLVGFEVGRPAPTDAYQALHSDGGVTGPAVTTHPGGGAVQIVTAGTTVTEGVMRALTAADAPSEA